MSNRTYSQSSIYQGVKVTKYEFYSNVNGKETRKSGTVAANDFDALIFDLISGKTPSLVTDVMNKKVSAVVPPRSNKNHCDNSFPPSNAWVDPETKEIKIVLAANDVMDDEYQVDLDDDLIVVTFDRKPREADNVFYDWKGLKFVKDEVVKFRFDQRMHNAATTEIKLERGCLFITMQPREEIKPIRKTLAGGIKKTPSTDEAVEQED